MTVRGSVLAPSLTTAKVNGSKGRCPLWRYQEAGPLVGCRGEARAVPPRARLWRSGRNGGTLRAEGNVLQA